MPPFNILIAEDFPAFRQLACEELRRQPAFRVVTVSDGVSAVESAETLRPDLIMLDIGLPGLDGFSAARRILEFSPTSRIVFLTHESSSDVVDEVFTLGAYGYVHKTRVKYLLPIVESILDCDSTGVDRRHRAQFCSDDAMLLDTVERHLASALGTGHAAVAVTTRTHLAHLVEGLRRLGIDVDHAIDTGAFVSLDADDLSSAILSDGVRHWQPALLHTIESAARAATRPHPRVAVFGECASMLCAAGHVDVAMDLERLGGEMVRSMAVDILCTYLPPPLNGNVAFPRVCARHGAIAVC